MARMIKLTTDNFMTTQYNNGRTKGRAENSFIKGSTEGGGGGGGGVSIR